MPNSNGQSGFTILEALVAFTILAVFLALLYDVLRDSARSVARGRLAAQAALIAESQLDLLRARQIEPEWNNPVSLQGGRFSIVYAPVDLDASAVDALAGLWRPLGLRAVVSWRENGATRSYAVETIMIAKRGRSG